MTDAEFLVLLEECFDDGLVDESRMEELRSQLTSDERIQTFLLYREMVEWLPDVCDDPVLDGDMTVHRPAELDKLPANAVSSRWMTRLKYVTAATVLIGLGVLSTSLVIARHQSNVRTEFATKLSSICLALYEENLETLSGQSQEMQSIVASYMTRIGDRRGLVILDESAQGFQALQHARMGFPESSLNALSQLESFADESNRRFKVREFECTYRLMVGKATLEALDMVFSRKTSKLTEEDRKRLATWSEESLAYVDENLSDDRVFRDQQSTKSLLLAAVCVDRSRIRLKVRGEFSDPIKNCSRVDQLLEEAKDHLNDAKDSQSDHWWLQKARYLHHHTLLLTRILAYKSLHKSTPSIEADKVWKELQTIQEYVDSKSSPSEALLFELAIGYLNFADYLNSQEERKLPIQEHQLGLGRQSRLTSLKLLQTISIPNRTERCKENLAICVGRHVFEGMNELLDSSEVSPEKQNELLKMSVLLQGFVGNVLHGEMGQLRIRSRIAVAILLNQDYSTAEIESYLEQQTSLRPENREALNRMLHRWRKDQSE